MRLVFFCLVSILYIGSIENSQCSSSMNLAGYCGCCSLIGGNCIYYNTLDNIDISWHLCVPDYRRESFSLDQCQPHVLPDMNFTRICRTKNETFRLFPQCATKDICSLPLSSRICIRAAFH
jgi:hypothetical protein